LTRCPLSPHRQARTEEGAASTTVTTEGKQKNRRTKANFRMAPRESMISPRSMPELSVSGWIRRRGERIEARTSTALVAFVGSFHGVFVRQLIEVALAQSGLYPLDVPRRPFDP
jgi:hypothetical protein